LRSLEGFVRDSLHPMQCGCPFQPRCAEVERSGRQGHRAVRAGEYEIFVEEVRRARLQESLGELAVTGSKDLPE